MGRSWTQEVHHRGRISQVKWRFSQIRKSNSWFVQFIQLILANTQCFSTTTRFTDQQKGLCRKSLYNYSLIRVVSVFFTCFLRVKTKPLFHDLQIAVKPLFHVRHTGGAFKFMWPSSQSAFCLRTQEIYRIRKLRNETAKVRNRTITKKKRVKWFASPPWKFSEKILAFFSMSRKFHVRCPHFVLLSASALTEPGLQKKHLTSSRQNSAELGDHIASHFV